jgi:hypothetical protein
MNMHFMLAHTGFTHHGARVKYNKRRTENVPHCVKQNISFRSQGMLVSTNPQKIKENKAKSAINIEFGDDDDEQLPDPGFRIYYTDPDTNEEIEVPPYTSQVDFHSALEAKKKIGKAVLSRTESQVSKVNESSTGSLESNTNYDEQTYDGYQDIQQANSRASRDEELKLMREARKQNRLGQSGIDDTTIGLERMDEDEVRPG